MKEDALQGRIPQDSVGRGRRWAQYNPFRCSVCKNPNIRSFLTMYTQGTSTSTYRKGLIFWHGWAKSWRQTEIAKRCAPPKKKSFVSAFLLLIVAALGCAFGLFSGGIESLTSSKVSLVFFFVGWLGLYLFGYSLFWNLRCYPQFVTEYSRLHFCSRCGSVTRV